MVLVPQLDKLIYSKHMPSLRSLAGKTKYQEYLKANITTSECPLCERRELKKFQYWKIVENIFPYDLIAQTHHMIVPLRHVIEVELTEEELKELGIIKKNLIENEYDYIIEATAKNKSIAKHFHLHLLIGISST